MVFFELAQIFVNVSEIQTVVNESYLVEPKIKKQLLV